MGPQSVKQTQVIDMENLPDFSRYGDVVREAPNVVADPTNPETFGGLPKQGDTGEAVFEVQQALADRNISSVGEVDGAFGNKTSLGIQEFQGKVGLPRTGVLNQDTYTQLVETPPSFDEEGKVQVTPIERPDFSAFGEVVSVEGEQETPVESPETNEGPASSSLLDFIGSGEGGYDSANRGTIGGNVVGSQMTASRNGKDISSMTIGEIQRLQSISDPNNPQRLFAVGKYQTIPVTLANAVEGLGLSEDTVFSPEVQEQIGWFLVTEKRPRVGQYIRGEGSVTEDDAMMSLAREFASVPVPRAVRKGEFGSWPKTDLQAGDSFYSDPEAGRGNRAAHSVDETRAVLRAARKNR
jgi:peptidoglycan hydrolase-like protein with peptidoglycan-binding domain